MKYYNTLEQGCIQNRLNTEILGKHLRIFSAVTSTNEEAKQLPADEIEEGLVLVASSQAGGRGRFGRKWISPVGGLWFSVILKPQNVVPTPLTVIFGGALSQVLEDLTGLPVVFHWPNDLFIDNKKVGGILLESRFRGEKMDYLVAGIGINVNFSGYVLGSDLKFQPTTLYDESGKYYNLSELLASVLNRLDQTYYEFIKTGSIELIEYYKKKCMTLGRRIVVIYDDKIREKAWALDVLPDGSLKIKTIENNKEKIILNVQKICLL